METEESTNDIMKVKLSAIEDQLEQIREDVSEILSTLEDELESFREREFWRDYRDTYQQE